jgi:hypothetical protein
VPLVTAVVLQLLPHRPKVLRLVAFSGALGILAAASVILVRVESEGVQVVQIASWQAPFGITLVADLFSAMLVLMVGIIGTAITAHSFSGVDPRREAFGYHALIQVLLMGVAGAFLTGDQRTREKAMMDPTAGEGAHPNPGFVGELWTLWATDPARAVLLARWCWRALPAELAQQGLGRDRIIAAPLEIPRRAPDLIFGSWCGKKFNPRSVAARAGWAEVPAVRDGELHEVKSSIILQPGPAALTELAYLERAGARELLISRWHAPEPFPHAALFRRGPSLTRAAGSWRALRKIHLILETS